MNPKAGGCLLLFLTLLVGVARAAEPNATLPPLSIDDEAVKDKDKPKPPDDKKKPPESPKTDLFNTPALMGGQFATGFNPQMMGDFPGSFARQRFTSVGTQTIAVTGVQRDGTIGTTTMVVPTNLTRTILVPASSGAGFKIADNASPRPQDRVFFTYNYFGNLHGPQTGPNDPINSTQTFNTPLGNTIVVNTFIPAAPNLNANLHREVFGFEKTFFDGYASIELRVPLLQQSSNVDGFSSKDIGDLTIIGKYAFLLDQDTGNVFSAGLAVTAPIGPSIATIDGKLHSTLLQPWVGYIWNSERFFLQAFHSVAVPTDSRDVTLLFNDVGLNCWLFRGAPNQRLQFIVPMLEAHVTTPLNHRDGNGPIYVPDLVILTGGLHVGVGRNATLSFGVATPVTGPRIMNIEAFGQFNLRF